MKNEKNTKAENPRTLEIKLLVPWQRWQWLIFIVYITMTAALTWLAFYGLTHEPFMSSTQALVAAVMAVMTVLRIRYLKSLFLRIDDNGCSWRLIDGVELMQRMRPPISEHVVRWESVRELHHEASGIRFSIAEKTNVFVPLSNFSYAQRQEIKRVIGLHLSKQNITAHAFTPVGWHDEPEVEAGEGDSATLGVVHASVEGESLGNDNPTTETR